MPTKSILDETDIDTFFDDLIPPGQTLEQLEAKEAEAKAALERVQQDIERRIDVERPAKIKEVQAIIARYRIKLSDLQFPASEAVKLISANELAGKTLTQSESPKREVSPAKPVEPKYRHPTTGDTWTGRGTMKKWVKDLIEDSIRAKFPNPESMTDEEKEAAFEEAKPAVLEGLLINKDSAAATHTNGAPNTTS